GGGVFFMGDGAYFDNRPGAQVNIPGDDDIRYLDGVLSTFKHASGDGVRGPATVRKTQGSVIDPTILGDVFLQFNNGGVVDVQAGILSLNYAATTPPSVDTGRYMVTSPSARLRFGGPNSTRSLPVGSFITGTGTVEFNAGTVTIAGTYDVAGNTEITG